MLRTEYKRLIQGAFLRRNICLSINSKFFIIKRLQSSKNTTSGIDKKEETADLIIDHENRNLQLKKITIVVKEEHTNEEKIVSNNDSISVLDKKLQELQSKPVDFHYYLRSLHKIQKDKLPYKFGINQMHNNVRENSAMDMVLNDIIKRFDSPVNYAFGYGSKVFSQGSNVDISNSQIDIICAVSNPIEWHRQNIISNGSDYSFMKYLGPSAINYVGNLGAGIYFNPFVDINIKGTPLELKYGITSVDTLVDDLTNWSTMYLSGRLHKPVAIVQNSPQLLFLNQYNLANAVKLSLLLLNKQQIKESELYLTIAGLSYMGDPRLKVQGENPDKVKNIVENQFQLFKALYKPFLENYFPELIQSVGDNGTIFTDAIYNINLSEEQISNIIIELPRKFRSRIFNLMKATYGNELSKDQLARDMIINPSLSISTTKNTEAKIVSYNDLRSLNALSTSELLSDIPREDWEYLPTEYKVKNSPFVKSITSFLKENPQNMQFILSKTVENTVSSSALVQSVKGILTAGLVRSYKYALAKRKKYLQAQAKNQK